MMLTDKQKNRIESLSTDDMAYEIELDYRSRFQHDKFAYLKSAYAKRIAEIQNPTPNPSTDISNNEKRPRGGKPLKNFAFGVAVIIFAAITVWVINHYLSIGL